MAVSDNTSPDEDKRHVSLIVLKTLRRTVGRKEEGLGGSVGSGAHSRKIAPSMRITGD